MTQKRIFLSHASVDAEAARAFCAALEQRGATCWMAPRDIPPGGDYASSIVEAIRDARGLFLVLSAAANKSSHIVREVERAASHNLPLFPIRIENVQPTGSLEYFLSNAQWIDAFSWKSDKDRAPVVESVLSTLGDRESRKPTVAPRTPRARILRWVWLGAATVVGLGAVVLGRQLAARWLGDRDGGAEVPVAREQLDSLALGIGRFVNLTGDDKNAHIGAGLADRLTSVLSDAGIQVVPSAAPDSADPRVVGAALHVAHLLRGSVRHDGRRVRVSAQLLRTDSGRVKWAQEIERNKTELFALEDTVALAVASAVKGRLFTTDSANLRKRPTSVLAAYDAYLRAKYVGKDSTPAALREASTQLQRAVRLDPQYVTARLELSRTYAVRSRSDPARRQALLQLALSESTKAMSMGENAVFNVRDRQQTTLADTTRETTSPPLVVLPFDRSPTQNANNVVSAESSKETRAVFDKYYARDNVTAEREFRARIAANSKDALAVTGLGYVLLASRRVAEAKASFVHAAAHPETDPLAVAGYGAASAASRDGASAYATLRYLATMNLDPAQLALGRAIVLGALGRASESRASLAQAQPLGEFLHRFARSAPALHR